MLKFELEPYNRNVPEVDLLDDLRTVAAKVGGPSLTRDAYDTNGGKFHSGTLEKRFGTWTKALERAGLTVITRKNIPNDELFANLESVWRHLGRQPRYDKLRTPLSKFSVQPYQARFGSFRKALESFVADINEGDSGALEADETESELLPAEPIQSRPSRYIVWRTRFLVMRRDGFRCVGCGRSPASSPGIELHIDHIEAWSKNGPTSIENLRTLCSVCNIGKSDLAAL